MERMYVLRFGAGHQVREAGTSGQESHRQRHAAARLERGRVKGPRGPPGRGGDPEGCGAGL
eukprot:11184543-Lingulodinium_polyedra.AAC.1